MTTIKRLIAGIILGLFLLTLLAYFHPALAQIDTYQPTADDIAQANQHWIEKHGNTPPPLTDDAEHYAQDFVNQLQEQPNERISLQN